MLQAEPRFIIPQTKNLLSKLNFALEEARLVRKTIALGDHLKQIENMPEQDKTSRYIRLEMADIEKQLFELREKVSNQ